MEQVEQRKGPTLIVVDDSPVMVEFPLAGTMKVLFIEMLMELNRGLTPASQEFWTPGELAQSIVSQVLADDAKEHSTTAH